ncbi:unnamed protein product [Orchesella dallaii]|uniref:Uncharacterized protein n=1 Tax=Orchesella dallaii TaxID=48710 RepID=A0ABP1Q9L9_9HEXA
MGTSVALLAEMKDPELLAKCARLSHAEMISLKNAAATIVNAKHLDARLLHARFHQKQILDIYGLESFQLPIGSILQVLDFAYTPNTTDWAIYKLLTDAVVSVPEESKYPGLTGVEMLNSLSICIRTGEIVMYQPNDVTATLDWEITGLSLEDKMDEMQRHLIPLEPLSMIVLLGADYCDEDEIADAQMWVNFLKGIYGGLEEMWVVLVFNGPMLPSPNAFPDLDIDETFRLLNRNAAYDTMAATKFIEAIGDDFRVSTYNLAMREE